MTEFPREQTEVQAAIEAELRDSFGDDIDLTDASVFSTLAEVFSTVIAENQEQSLQEVYESAFLDTATGEDLDAVVALAQLTRRSAVSATGVERFSASEQVSGTSVIQRGTVVQTNSTDPTRFETTERTSLQFFDDFEDSDTLNSYEGDTTDASVVTTNVYNGLQSLQLDAVADSHVYDPTHSVKRGSSWSVHMRLSTGTAPTATWAIETFTNHYQAVVDDDNEQVRIEEVVDGTTTTLTSESFDPPTGSYLRVDITWDIDGTITVTLVDPDTNSEYVTVESGVTTEYLEGPVGYKTSNANGTVNFDYASMESTTANIRAVESGPAGNVGTNSVTVLPTNITNVTSVTNQKPVGDSDFTNTDGIRFVAGEDEETDDELRERAKRSLSDGGAGTADAILGELVNNVTGVRSVSVYENNTDVDNTGSGGLPPYSFEVVVYGGDSLDIAESIYDKKAVTARDYGGVRGTEVTETIVSSINEQTWDISFTRPAELQIDITVDLIVDDTYVGNAVLRDAIVQYIGGVQSDGSDVIGIGVSENVRIDQIRDIVVNDEYGVVGLDYSVDGTPLSTTPTSTTVDGLDVIEVSENEVAETDATDGSITINTREQ